MKNFTLSIIAMMAISTFATAETYDAYGPNSYKAQHDGKESNHYYSTEGGSFYLGGAYSYLMVNLQQTRLGNKNEWDINGNGFTLLAGYNINEYIAMESRYTFTIGDFEFENGRESSADFSNISLFIKPKYSIDSITLYGLLGFGQLDEVDDGKENGFQWGLGFSVSDGDKIDAFIDYTRLYDDEGFNGGPNNNICVDALNFGIAFKF